MEQGTIVLLTLVVYKAILLGIGVVAERRTKNEADFLIGGRALGPLVAAISASASSSSVWTLLGVSGYAYANGLSALWLLPACIGGFALNWFAIAPRLRRQALTSGALTLTDFLAGPRRGRGFAAARWTACAILLISLTGYVAQQFNGAGRSLEENFGLPLDTSILLGGAIVLLYTLLGGFWAVSLTDTLQGLLMAGTAVLLPVAALIAVGGFEPLASGIHSAGPDFASLWPTGSRPGGVTIAILLAIGAGYPGQPHVVNRFMALRDEAALRAARRYALAWAVLVYAGMVLLGLCARVMFADAEMEQDIVFFAAMGKLFSPVITGILLAAVLSAVMSTADSQLLVAASAVSHDLGFGRGDPRTALWRSRGVVTAVGAAAVAAAMLGSKEIFDSVLIAWTAIGAAFGPLLLVTLWRGPVGPRRTLVAMLVGFGTTAIGFALPATRGGWVERLLPYALAFAVLLPVTGSPRRPRP